MKIKVEKKSGVILTPMHSVKVELSHNLPGRRWRKEGQLHFELCAANIRHIRDVYPQAEWSSQDPLKKLEKIESQGKKTRAQKLLETMPAEAQAFPFKTKPFDHQKKVFFISKDLPVFALFMEMGTGKTKPVIDTAAYLHSIGEIDTLLITAPNGVHGQWITEQIPLHMPDFVNYRAITYQSNWTKQFKEDFEHVMEAPPEELKIISMHIQAFQSKKGQDIAARILSSSRALWTVDESTRIKTPGAARTKAILKLAPLAPYRRIMSGAPITQGVEDLYSQLKFLDEDILGFSSFWSFKAHFCIERPIPGAPPGAKRIVGYQNLDFLKDRLEDHSFRVTKADCLDLPDKLYMTREVPLTPEQQKAYEEIKTELITELETGDIVEAPMAATRLMKLQQIICGFLIPEVDADPVPIKSNRIAAAIDIVKETQGQILIWARFRHDIANLSKELKKADISFVEYHGGISQEDRVDAIKQFKEGTATVFLANPQAGGTGLNLAEASTAIYFSNDFNADTRWQSEDRIHRIGQKNQCTYIDLIAPGTIDKHILKSLKNKKNVADNVLDVKEILEML